MKNSNYIHSEITDKIIKAFFNVYNKLGYGFYEKVYERALMIELDSLQANYKSQPAIKVYYDGKEIGKYVPDLVVEDCVVVEIKAVGSILSAHEDQLRNALRASGMEVGLLLNFGIQPQFKRKVFSNEFKSHLSKPS